jgi:hypothetical protein
MNDREAYVYVLPSGAKIEIENLPETRRGARDVAKGVKDRAPVPFEDVISPLGELCELVFDKLKSSIRAPETVALELSASLKGKTSLVVVSGETEGTIKVTLTWKKSS